MTLDERSLANRQNAQNHSNRGVAVMSGRQTYNEDTKTQLSADPLSSFHESGALSSHRAV